MSRQSILDKNVNKLRGDINLATYAYLFVELVKYSEAKMTTVDAIHKRLADFGSHVGVRMLDLVFMREKVSRREIKLQQMLLFIKGTFWKNVFGKEANELERAVDNENTYYLIETEPIVNKFISLPKDKGNLNCAAFCGGILESVLCNSGFPCKVTTLYHKGTTYVMKFDDAVITRDRSLEGR